MIQLSISIALWLLTLLNLIMFGLFLRFQLKYKNVLRMASIAGTMMVEQREHIKQNRQQTELATEAKEMIAKEVKAKIPFIPENMSGKHLFALVGSQDFTNFVKGISVLSGISIDLAQILGGWFKERDKSGSGRIEYA